MGKKTLQVDVTDLAETMDFGVPEGLAVYLDLRTGEIVHPDGERDVHENLEPIPPFDKHYRYERMLRFVATLDAELRPLFEVALDGQGAFRRFSNLVNQQGIADAWHAFQLRLDRAEAMDWLAAHDLDVIDVSTRVPPAEEEVVGTPLSLVDLLLLGAPDGKTELLAGQVWRRVPARSAEESRELFRALARAIAAETGVTLPGSTGAIGQAAPTDTLDAGRFHLYRHDDAVEVAVDMPPAVWDRFADR